ncbi:MAG: class I SAM-dependent methyltransferase [Bdellovibrionales bacterium]|nr:class I SAM-dependent methyltransferase [Bdellovibrionales bacterium]
MNVEQLQTTLREIQNSNSSEKWYEGLNARKKEELEFHNRDRDQKLTESLPQDAYELLHGNKKYYSTTQISRKYVMDWVAREAKGKTFLDYACGNGENALFAAKSGAALAIGLDISDVSVRNAQEKANSLNLKNTFFIQGDCENTGLPSNSIDVIICSGMLHHLDLSYAFPELRRILKPGGKILAVEALNYNPIIKLYRMITPSMRTEWEKNHILSMKDITFARRFFEIGEVRFWHILSYFAAFLHKQPALMNPLLRLFNAMDALLTRLPLVQLLGWQFTFELVKRRED